MRDIRSGRWINAPENGYAPHGVGGYRAYGGYQPQGFFRLSGGNAFGNPRPQHGRIIYDGLGNPVGIFPFIAALAPLAAKAVAFLPKIASSILPMLTGGGGGGAAAGALPKIASNLIPALTNAATPDAPQPLMPTTGPRPPTNMAPPQPEDSMMIPMRVQTPSGERVIPVRVRGGRRSRRRVSRPVMRLIARAVLPPPPNPVAPPPDPRNLQGWAGYGRW